MRSSTLERHSFIFTTLAMNQTIFFVGWAKEMRNRGHDVCIVSFHEESCQYITEQGVTCYNIFEGIQRDPDIHATFASLCESYGMDEPNILMSHEKIAFNIKKTVDIKTKYCNYIKSFEKIITGIQESFSGKLFVIQELGGFSSLLSCYFVAKKHGIDNIFLEPSFFRGRVFFVKNDISSIDVGAPDSPITDVPAELKTYLEETLAQKKIVIPMKDKAGYRNPIKKMLSRHNITRLFQKIFSKVIKKKQEEFSYIGHHVKRHVRMLINNVLLRRFYATVPEDTFIYFPMHVPNDVALTVRSPEYFDQLGLIHLLARSLPIGTKLAIKEHPAMLGDIDRKRISETLKMFDNVVLLEPRTNNYDVLLKASLIVTINSKAGAEAALLGKPVLVLGDAFYDKSPLVSYIDNLKDLRRHIAETLTNNASGPSEDDIQQYFAAVWEQSYRGDIYFDDESNYNDFSDSLLEYLDKHVLLPA